MSRLRSSHLILAGVAFLSACAQSPIGGGANPSLNFSRTRAERSWVSPQARGQDLLYVSVNSGYVYIFSFPAGRLVGTLTGFQEVAGVCADASGNVWVANSADFDLVEYAHGGSSPIGSLQDFENYTFSCSVDERSGDLAVSNIFSNSGKPGGIAIYRHAQGVPTIYSDSKFEEYYFLGYGPRGQIFFDGNGSVYAN